MKRLRKRRGRLLRFAAVATVLLGCAVAVGVEWPQASVSLAGSAVYPKSLRMDYAKVVKGVRDFEQREHDLHASVVSRAELARQLSLIQLDAESGKFAGAKTDIQELRQSLANWNFELSGGSNVWAEANGISLTGGITLPILVYHYPPPNFEEQLVHLEQAGYTVVSMDQVVAGLRGDPLPPKPVAITFDDGFEPQLAAAATLAKHHMPATYYIIDGGEASRWCIGAGRRYGDPLQPRGGCGDAYLTWDQVRALDRGGLITIGGHTINHRNLATLSEADQRLEITTGKEELEAQLGHSVRHFAYPYGAYNELSIRIAQEAGYLSAVSTQPGDTQPPGSLFALRRVRDAMLLP